MIDGQRVYKCCTGNAFSSKIPAGKSIWHPVYKCHSRRRCMDPKSIMIAMDEYLNGTHGVKNLTLRSIFSMDGGTTITCIGDERMARFSCTASRGGLPGESFSASFKGITEFDIEKEGFAFKTRPGERSIISINDRDPGACAYGTMPRGGKVLACKTSRSLQPVARS
jgi:hypothetical protein